MHDSIPLCRKFKIHMKTDSQMTSSIRNKAESGHTRVGSMVSALEDNAPGENATAELTTFRILSDTI